jgi:hypothetical protein
VIDATALFPSLVTVICAVPADTPATRPLGDTVATAALLEPQFSALPVSKLLFASWVSAESWSVSPSTTLPVEGLTVTDATGTGVTVRVALPVSPSLVAVIVDVPGAAEVTSPVAGSTVATERASELQTMLRPVSTLLFPSSVVAVA